MRCGECGDRIRKEHSHPDPRDPPGDDLCKLCLCMALEEMIECHVQDAKELQAQLDAVKHE